MSRSKPKKKSGGKRAVEKKHRERAAKRQRAAAAAGELGDLVKQLDDIGPAPTLEPDRIPHWLDQVAVVVRNVAWRREWAGALERELGALPTTIEELFVWLGRASALLVNATLRDTAVPPEQLRRDAMRQIEQTAKVLNPARLSEQLAELERAVAQLQENAQQHAGKNESGADSPAPAGSPQH